jgi:hypothetical protein
MHIERLTKLAELMETIQKDMNKVAHFDLGNWIGRYSISNKVYAILRDENSHKFTTDLIVECGTTACACGYAGMDPWFREQGLKLDQDACMSYKNFIGWSAVQFFFDISEDHAEFLFSEDKYNSFDYPGGAKPADVAFRIRCFIDQQGQL